MVKKLHEQGEFNEHCAPSRRRTIINIEIPIENKIFTLADRLFEKKNDSSFQVFPRQVKERFYSLFFSIQSCH